MGPKDANVTQNNDGSFNDRNDTTFNTETGNEPTYGQEVTINNNGVESKGWWDGEQANT